MLDGAHAGLHTALDGGRRIGVGEHVRVGAGRLVDDGLELVHGELEHVDGVGLGGDAAGGVDLDLIGAQAELVADRLQAFRHPVGDAPRARAEVGAEAGLAQVADQALVPVAAGLGDGPARDQEPGSDEEAFLDRLPVAGIGAAGVADGGEAPHQHAAQLRRRPRRGDGGEHVEVGIALVDDVVVAVQQPRHQGAPAQIDDRGVAGRDLPLLHLDDLPVTDQDLAARDELAPGRVEQGHVAKQVSAHTDVPSRVLRPQGRFSLRRPMIPTIACQAVQRRRRVEGP